MLSVVNPRTKLSKQLSLFRKTGAVPYLPPHSRRNPTSCIAKHPIFLSHNRHSLMPQEKLAGRASLTCLR